jgi:hypothetical protein
MTFGRAERIRKMPGFPANLLPPVVRLPGSNGYGDANHEMDPGALSRQARSGRRKSAPERRGVRRTADQGAGYAVFRLPDDTFVHLASLEDGATPLSSLESFRAFQKDIRERCAEPPQPAEPRLIGDYGMLSQKT